MTDEFCAVMSLLADRLEYVIGVDTHRDAHTVAVCTPTGAVVAGATVAADAVGYRRLLSFARERAAGCRVWAIEGTGSFGAGLVLHVPKVAIERGPVGAAQT